MLELARPEVRVHSTQQDRFAWGIVDFILAVPMLPFAIAALVIQTIVELVCAPFSD